MMALRFRRIDPDAVDGEELVLVASRRGAGGNRLDFPVVPEFINTETGEVMPCVVVDGRGDSGSNGRTG